MLQVGQLAPGFDLPDADMQAVSLAGFKNHHNVVLYFYPDRKSTRLNSSHIQKSRMPSSA